MSRQRLRPALSEGSHITCPRCNGTGHIRDTESSALQILRMVQEESMKDNTAAVHVQVPVEVTSFLLNEKRTEITKIELKQRVTVLLVPNKNLETPNYRLERMRHDDPRLENLQASYTMVDDADDEVGITRREKTKAKQEPVIKGILPETPAPQRVERPQAAEPAAGAARTPIAAPPAAAPAAGKGFFAWVKSFFGPAEEAPSKPVAALPAPATAGGESRRDRGDRAERGGRGGRGGRDGRRGERSAERTGDRAQANGEGRGRRDRAGEPTRDASGAEARGVGEAREGRGGRGDRGDRAERGDRGERSDRAERGDRGERNRPETRGEQRNEQRDARREARPGAQRSETPVDETTTAESQEAMQPAFADTLPQGEDAATGERQGGRRRRRGGRGRDRSRDEGGAERDVASPDSEMRDDGSTTEASAAADDDRLRAANDDARPPREAREGEGGEAGEPRGEGGRRRGRDRGRDRGPREGARFADSEAPGAEAAASEVAERTSRDDRLAHTVQPAPGIVTGGFESAGDWRSTAAATARSAEVEAVRSESAAHVAPTLPRAEPYALPIDSLAAVAESAGLQWVNSDASKIAAAQAAIAALPTPPRVPREIVAVAAIDEGPLVMVETKKDLGQVKLPFETTAQETQGL
jgi:ribonuclease E